MFDPPSSPRAGDAPHPFALGTASPSRTSGGSVGEPARVDWRFAAIALVLVSAAMIWPAVYNGYPLVFSDTWEYVWTAGTGSLPAGRSIGYGVFLMLTGLRTTLWSSIAVQGAVCAAAIWLTLWSYRPPNLTRRFVAIGLAVAIATPVSWFASQAMPDFLTGVAILSVFVLVLRWRQVGPLGVVAAGALLVLACVSHNGNLLLTGALAVLASVFGALRSAGTGGGDLRARLRAGAGAGLRVGLPLLVGCTLLLAMNYRQSGGRVFITQGGHAFLLGRLVESKILPRLLADRCGRVDYILCPYRHQLGDSLEYFMFERTSPIKKFGGVEGLPKGPSMRMVEDAVRYYPGAVLGSSLRNSARQFVTFYTGDGLHPWRQSAPRYRHVSRAIRTMYPAEYAKSYTASHQQQGTLPLPLARAVHGTFVWAGVVGSALALLAALRAWRRGQPAAAPPAAGLHVAVWLGAALNAAICATISTVTDRFQARVVWLFFFACLVTLACAARVKQREG